MVLCIVKIISPVVDRCPDYDGYIVRPREGELLHHQPQGRSQPWSYNVDDTKFPALKELIGDE
jgi:hypothetical protein